MNQHPSDNIRRITLVALISALIFVLTTALRIPTLATNGYIHLGDAGITFAAYAFGPWVAMVAGGLGTALADLMGYPQWAVFSLIVHGVQGWVIGQIVKKTFNAGTLALSVVASTVVVVGGYFVAGCILSSPAVAVTEMLPNTIQALSGGVVGIPLYFAVRKAYPLLQRYGDHKAQ